MKTSNLYDLVLYPGGLTRLTAGKPNETDTHYHFSDESALSQGKRSMWWGFIIGKSEQGRYIYTCRFMRSGDDSDDGKLPIPVFSRVLASTGEEIDVSRDKLIITMDTHTGCYKNFWPLMRHIEKLFASKRDRDIENLLKDDEFVNGILTRKEIVRAVINSPTALENILLERDGKSLNDIIDNWDFAELREQHWQNLFTENAWILPMLLPSNYTYFSHDMKRLYCGGKKIDNTGGVEADFGLIDNPNLSVGIVEIKVPNVLFFNETEGRAGVYPFSSDFSLAVNQCLHQKETFIKQYREFNASNLINILIIGRDVKKQQKNSSIIQNAEQKNYIFQTYRGSLHNLLILTYDEVYEKIRRLREIYMNNYN